MATKTNAAPETPAPEEPAASGMRVRFDTQSLKSSYANVCTMTSTREEVVLNFGINQAWERSGPEVEIQLSDRIILSPFAAKRMAESLNKLLAEYEARYGTLGEERGAQA